MPKKTQARTAQTRATRTPDATAGKRQPEPKTAYELLQRVCEAIRAHPLAYYQGSWVLPNKLRVQYACDFTAEQMRESCGTAYCRAGWIVAVKDGHRKALHLGAAHVLAPFPRLPVADRANEILGLDMSATRGLFEGSACDAYGAPGTRAYVNAGVRGLRDFMKQHATHLKSRLLKGV